MDFSVENVIYFWLYKTSKRLSEVVYLPLQFNNHDVQSANSQTHLE